MEAVIFDFNGVLWWDGNLQDKAWKAYSKKLRGWPLTDEEMAVHVHGRNSRYTLEYLLGGEVTGERLERLSEGKESVYRDLCLNQGDDFKLSPGGVELLNFLVEQQVPCTIATASAKPNVDFFVRNLELARWFDLKQLVYDDGQKAGKPAPDFYLQAASMLGKNPGNCIVIEDSRSGIAAAKAAGAGRIVALGPKKDQQELGRLEGVDLVIESLYEFPKSLIKDAVFADRR